MELHSRAQSWSCWLSIMATMFTTLVWRVYMVKTQTTAEDDGGVIRFYRYETGTCKIICSCWTKVHICAKDASRSRRQDKMLAVYDSVNLIRSHLFTQFGTLVAAKTVTALWHRWKVLRRPHDSFQLCSCLQNQMLIMRPQDIFSSGILIQNIIFPNLNQVFFMPKPDQGRK